VAGRGIEPRTALSVRQNHSRSKKMEHMQYVGPKESLRGQGALVRLAEQPGKVLVQFDFPPRRPNAERDETWCLDHPECFGWHEFDERDFAPTAELTGHVRPIHEVVA